jgi:phospholipid/cholesterol/gamma-HCH transport system ATP-binding protein
VPDRLRHEGRRRGRGHVHDRSRRPRFARDPHRGLLPHEGALLTAAAAPPAAGVPAIRLRGVSKAFGPKVVLDHLDLTVEKGESLVLLGQSGIGKSVLLKHIVGLLKPDAGSVEIDGEDLWAVSPRERDVLRRKFGMSFQEGALFDSMSVGENIAFPLVRHTKKSKKEVAERVTECLELVRLPGIEDKRPSELSGGMRRRVGFARAIALEPQILLFDEPTTGLDPITTDVLVRVIQEMRQKLNPTAITITHDLKVAFACADRVGLLAGGKIAIDMPPKEFETSNDPRVAAFVKGDSELAPPEVEPERRPGVPPAAAAPV